MYYRSVDCGDCWYQSWKFKDCKLFLVTEGGATFERVKYPNLCKFEHSNYYKGVVRVDIINDRSNASSVITGYSRIKTVKHSRRTITTTYDGNNKSSKMYERCGKEWYESEKMHNKYGPAITYWDERGNVRRERYMIRGTELTREEFARVAKPKSKAVRKTIERILPWPIASEICQNYRERLPRVWPKFREERRELPDGYVKEWWLGDRHITHTYTSTRMHFVHMFNGVLEMEFIGDGAGRAEKVTFNMRGHVEWSP